MLCLYNRKVSTYLFQMDFALEMIKNTFLANKKQVTLSLECGSTKVNGAWVPARVRGVNLWLSEDFQ